MIDRRRFLARLAGGAALGLAGARLARGAPQPVRYLGAARQEDGGFVLVGIDGAGGEAFRTPLPARAHDAVVRPGAGECVVLARRPGRFFLAVDLHQGLVREHRTCPADRHLCGHGAFSADGALLYTTENDFDRARGVLGVYDARDGYRRVGELPTHGIGPHEVLHLPESGMLVIANGGILTHPDTGRAKLNIPTMAPSLAYVDAEDGRLLEQARLPAEHHRLSIRHIDRAGAGGIAVGMQYQGQVSGALPLVAVHRPGEPLRPLSSPAGLARRMRGYCGSVRCAPGGTWLAVSAPRGGLVTFWSLEEQAYAGALDLEDGCGVAAADAPDTVVLSAGTGRLLRSRISAPAAIAASPLTGPPGLAWDNHLRAVAPEPAPDLT